MQLLTKKMISRLLSVLQLAAENPGTVAAKLRGADARVYALLSRPWLKQLQVNTVLDVGANVGHWAKACRLALPDVFISSFEPIPECQNALSQQMANDPKHTIFPYALGRTRSELKLHLHSHAASSSLLTATKDFKGISNGSVAVRELPVSVETLDNIARENRWPGPYLLKLDVQGYELEVLRGAASVLPKTALIIAETSFRPLYQEQAIFGDIHRHLTEAGFSYCGAAESVLRLSSGLEVQQDSLFVRNDLMQHLAW